MVEDTSESAEAAPATSAPPAGWRSRLRDGAVHAFVLLVMAAPVLAVGAGLILAYYNGDSAPARAEQAAAAKRRQARVQAKTEELRARYGATDSLMRRMQTWEYVTTPAVILSALAPGASAPHLLWTKVHGVTVEGSD